MYIHVPRCYTYHYVTYTCTTVLHVRCYTYHYVTRTNMFHVPICYTYMRYATRTCAMLHVHALCYTYMRYVTSILLCYMYMYMDIHINVYKYIHVPLHLHVSYMSHTTVTHCFFCSLVCRRYVTKWSVVHPPKVRIQGTLLEKEEIRWLPSNRCMENL